jgi:hypothetical protein
MDTKPVTVKIDVQQVGSCSASLNQCIDEFNAKRAGQGFLSCSSEDSQMIEQIVGQCTDFINEHHPHFDWCSMKVVIKEISDD